MGITSAKSPHKIKDVEVVAIELIELIRSKNKEVLERIYGIKDEGEEDNEIFLKIGENKKYLLKGGVVDENRTAVKIVEDWQKGVIGR